MNLFETIDNVVGFREGDRLRDAVTLRKGELLLRVRDDVHNYRIWALTRAGMLAVSRHNVREVDSP